MVVDDDLAADLVGRRAGAQHAHLGLAEKAHRLAGAVVFDATRLALDDLVEPLALLPEGDELAVGGGRDGELAALRGFLQFDLGRLELQRAAGDLDPAAEHAHLALAVEHHAPGVEGQRLGAVGALGLRRQHGRTQEDGHRHGPRTGCAT